MEKLQTAEQISSRDAEEIASAIKGLYYPPVFLVEATIVNPLGSEVDICLKVINDATPVGPRVRDWADKKGMHLVAWRPRLG